MDEAREDGWDARYVPGFEPGMGGVALIPRDAGGDGPVRLLMVALEGDRQGMSPAGLADTLLASAREGGLPPDALVVALPTPPGPYRGRADNVLRLSHALSQAALGRRPARETTAMVGVRDEGARVAGEAIASCQDWVRGFGLVSGRPSRAEMGPRETAAVMARKLLGHDDMLLAMSAATETCDGSEVDTRMLTWTVEVYRELLERLGLPGSGGGEALARVAAQEVRSWPPATRADFAPELTAVIRGLRGCGMWG